jgi:hypothetical protein
MAFKPKPAFKIATISLAASGVSYTRLLDGGCRMGKVKRLDISPLASFFPS